MSERPSRKYKSSPTPSPRPSWSGSSGETTNVFKNKINLRDMLRRRNKIRHHSSDNRSIEINQVFEVKTEVNFGDGGRGGMSPILERQLSELSKSPKIPPGKRRLVRHTTLAIISLDKEEGSGDFNEEENIWPTSEEAADNIVSVNQAYNEMAVNDQSADCGSLKFGSVSKAISQSPPLKTILKKGVSSSSVNTNAGSSHGGMEGGQKFCPLKVLALNIIQERPLVKLALVMVFNGFLSMACAAAIIQIEHPAQLLRMEARNLLVEKSDRMSRKLTEKLELVGQLKIDEDLDKVINEARELMGNYTQTIEEIHKYPREIEWNMLSAQSFITSIQTTTGYGDIVPSTIMGKAFAIGYALVGIPIFMWYIVKLGGLFRVIVIKIVAAAINCVCPMSHDAGGSGKSDSTQSNNAEATVVDLEALGDTGIIEDEKHDDTDHPPKTTVFPMKADSTPSEQSPPQPLKAAPSKLNIFGFILLETKSGIQQQMKEDKRFHPIIIGGILFIFLLAVSVFISHMENIGYFDSFYACFITYSTIGFGDIDIFAVSYRSNWFNLLIYGNLIHITGYMILSAWISSILDKFGVRKY